MCVIKLNGDSFLLVRHPPVLKRLHEEINSITEDDVELTKAHIQKMPFLRCVLNESKCIRWHYLSPTDMAPMIALRLYPPIPLNTRFAKRTTVLPRGGGSDGRSPILVKRGTGIAFVSYYLHRRKDIWGKDAREYRPERWEGLADMGWAYMPFHGGPRLCLGSKIHCIPSRVRRMANGSLHRGFCATGGFLRHHSRDPRVSLLEATARD